MMSYSNIVIEPCEPQEVPVLFIYYNVDKSVISM
jgi:hypothetical protein